MNRDIVWTSQFKKDYKLALKRHLDVDLLEISSAPYRVGNRSRRKTETML